MARKMIGYNQDALFPTIDEAQANQVTELANKWSIFWEDHNHVYETYFPRADAITVRYNIELDKMRCLGCMVDNYNTNTYACNITYAYRNFLFRIPKTTEATPRPTYTHTLTSTDYTKTTNVYDDTKIGSYIGLLVVLEIEKKTSATENYSYIIYNDAGTTIGSFNSSYANYAQNQRVIVSYFHLIPTANLSSNEMYWFRITAPYYYSHNVTLYLI